MNLEIVEAPKVDYTEIERQFLASSKGQLSTADMHKWILSNPSAFSSIFDVQIAPFFENTLFACNKIYAQTKEMLKFYKRYLQ